jgi:L-ascorbate metabolism protein UlaG (beta-lactamase superfamily)
MAGKAEALTIRYLGHSCFLLTDSKGVKLLTDPYETGAFGGALKYGKIDATPDVVTVSHEHADHNYIKGVLGKPEVVRGPGKVKAGGIEITGVRSYHDKSKGSERGENAIMVFTMDGMRICHLGDLGTMLDDAQVSEIGSVDILLVPVGGHFTIDAGEARSVVKKIKPKLTMPMHFKTKSVDFPIKPVEDFSAGMKNVRTVDGSEISVEKGKLKEEVVVLKPAL